MTDISVYRDADWIWNQSRNNPTVNEDILSFCSQSPHLVDFAYRLADHGHVLSARSYASQPIRWRTSLAGSVNSQTS